MSIHSGKLVQVMMTGSGFLSKNVFTNSDQ